MNLDMTLANKVNQKSEKARTKRIKEKAGRKERNFFIFEITTYAFAFLACVILIGKINMSLASML